jgi:hypothetical protein
VLHRLLGISLGALVTFVLLDFNTLSGDTTTKYGIAVLIGAIVNLLGPFVLAFLVGRARKSRRENEITAEVDRQVAEQEAPH